jgi:hypothetical protein
VWRLVFGWAAAFRIETSGFRSRRGQAGDPPPDTFEITSPGRTVKVGAPDVLGALIAKGAAYRVDSRDANRHLEDAALLLASIAAVRSLDLERLSANGRKHLVWIAGPLLDPRAAPWRTLTEAFRERGQRQLGRILTAVSPPIQPRYATCHIPFARQTEVAQAFGASPPSGSLLLPVQRPTGVLF